MFNFFNASVQIKILALILALVILLFGYLFFLSSQNKYLKDELEKQSKTYEASIKILENRYKFENQSKMQKEEVLKIRQKTQLENLKRGSINEDNFSDISTNFTIVCF